MIGEGTASIFGSGVALSVVGYGLFSAFVTGPEILVREVARLDWENHCRERIITEFREEQGVTDHFPQIDIGGVLDGLFGTGTSNGFGEVINPIENIIELSNEHTRRLQRLNEKRLQEKARNAGSRCACAVTILSERRVSLGLYAGTGRLVTPVLFKSLESELLTTLHSSQCGKGS
ncbi:MAG: hypothetical protein AAF478_11215 [Pseudomonadota bacterium]